MVFEQLQHEGCQSYLIGCPETCAGIVIDPESSLTERYLALATSSGLRIHYVLDTHTHADHFSASANLAHQLGVPTAMLSPSSTRRVTNGAGLMRCMITGTPS